MSDPLIQSLRELDTELQKQTLSSKADARILRAMSKHQRQSFVHPAALWRSPLAAVVVCFAVLFGGLLHLASHVPHSSTKMGGFLVIRGSFTFAEQGSLACGTPFCRLRFVERKVRIRLRKKGQILRKKEALHLLHGQAIFDVSRQRSRHGPLQISVSGGMIKVIGTRFTVWQGKGKGHLTLHKGIVHFVFNDGTLHKMKAGETLRWPKGTSKIRSDATKRRSKKLPSRKTRHVKHTQIGVSVRSFTAKPALRGQNRAVVAYNPPKLSGASRLDIPTSKKANHHSVDAKKIPIPVPVKMVHKPVDIVRKKVPLPKQRVIIQPQKLSIRWVGSLLKLREAKALSGFLDEIERLRSQGHFGDAAKKLRRKLKELRKPRYRVVHERFHYELGLLLTHQLKQYSKACKHWKKHRTLFASSRRYHQEIDIFLQRLHCSR